MRLSSRRGDDADLIRARLRALLAEGGDHRGWVPEDAQPWSPPEDTAADPWSPPEDTAAEPWSPPDEQGTGADEEREGRGGLPNGIGRHRAPGPAVRWDPGLRGAAALVFAAVLAACLVLGWTWLQRPRIQAVEGATSPLAAVPGPPSTPTPSSEPSAAASAVPVVVSVVGLVERPGLVTLPPGARVADAVAAAGGLSPEADPASVNLAAVLGDGQQVSVGAPGAPPAPGDGGTAPAQHSGPVNLNTAGVAELDALPGLGPVLAQRIVDHRTEHGPFASVEALDEVTGIGPAIAERLGDLVTV